jgi:hypothetical protein
MDDCSPSTKIPVDIKLRDGSSISILADRFETVLKLKEALTDRLGLYPSQQRLIYAGKLLSDGFSLDFYKIHPGSQIYFAPVPQTARVGQNPHQLLCRLIRLLSELPSADSHRYIDIVQEMAVICSNPTVQAQARLDPHVKQLLIDAHEALSLSERPSSRRTEQFVARAQDMIFHPYEISPKGYRAMKATLDTDEPVGEEEDGLSPTTIQYRKRISNQPLPNAWVAKDRPCYNSALMLLMPTKSSMNSVGTRRSTFECRISPRSRTRLAQGVEVLKKMGFGDETVILEALVETNGNVQLAAQLLQRHACD